MTITKLLIDSDVLLDFLADRYPFSEDAVKIFELNETRAIQCYVTPVIISNVYYVYCKTFKRERANSAIRALLEKVDVLVIDKTVILQALDSPFTDFEDAMQNYAAETNKKVTTIVTRNVKDYKDSSLSVMTPADFLRTFAAI